MGTDAGKGFVLNVSSVPFSSTGNGAWVADDMAAAVLPHFSTREESSGCQEQLRDFCSRFSAAMNDMRLLEQAFCDDLVPCLSAGVNSLERRLKEEAAAHEAKQQEWTRREIETLQQNHLAITKERAEVRRITQELQQSVSSAEKQRQELVALKEERNMLIRQKEGLEREVQQLDEVSKTGREELSLALEREKHAGEAAGRQARIAVKRLRLLQKQHQSTLNHCASENSFPTGGRNGPQSLGWIKTKQQTHPVQKTLRQSQLGGSFYSLSGDGSRSSRGKFSASEATNSAGQKKKRKSEEVEVRIEENAEWKENFEDEPDFVERTAMLLKHSAKKILGGHQENVQLDHEEKGRAIIHSKDKKGMLQANKGIFEQSNVVEQEPVQNSHPLLPAPQPMLLDRTKHSELGVPWMSSTCEKENAITRMPSDRKAASCKSLNFAKSTELDESKNLEKNSLLNGVRSLLSKTNFCRDNAEKKSQATKRQKSETAGFANPATLTEIGASLARGSYSVDPGVLCERPRNFPLEDEVKLSSAPSLDGKLAKPASKSAVDFSSVQEVMHEQDRSTVVAERPGVCYPSSIECPRKGRITNKFNASVSVFPPKVDFHSRYSSREIHKDSHATGKSAEGLWRTTRIVDCQPGEKGRDPHDDFLATPLELAIAGMADQEAHRPIALECDMEDHTHRSNMEDASRSAYIVQEKPVRDGKLSKEVPMGKHLQTSCTDSLPVLSNKESKISHSFQLLSSAQAAEVDPPAHKQLEEKLQGHSIPQCLVKSERKKKLKSGFHDASGLDARERVGGIENNGEVQDKRKDGHKTSVLNTKKLPTPPMNVAKPLYKFKETVRRKADREVLKGKECNSCKQFYDAVLAENAEGISGNKCDHYQEASRHRYRYSPPATPEGFWNIGFDTE